MAQEPSGATGSGATTLTRQRSSFDVVTAFLNNLFSPAIVLLVLAMVLDIIGIILIFFALDDFGITDIIGIVFIGGWILFRSQGREIIVSKKAEETAKKSLKKAQEKLKTLAEKEIPQAVKWIKRMKWLKPVLVIAECIPYIGVLPCWTAVVICEMLTY